MKKRIAFPESSSCYERAAMEVANYVIGFVELEEMSDTTDAHLAGSGTLVEVNGQPAILTADHVLEPLMSKETFGLVIPDVGNSESHQPTRPIVRTKLTKKIRVGKGKIDCEGPDLALLLLHDTKSVGTIKAKKLFCDISKSREKVLSKPHPVDEGVWVLSGFAAEWTQEKKAPERRLERVKEFNGKLLEVTVTNEYVREGFDYLKIKMKYPLSPDTPDNFRGYSGGGLWQVLVAEGENGEPVITGHVLSGVAFCQSKPEDDVRTITCHGRQSIYRNAIDNVGK